MSKGENHTKTRGERREKLLIKKRTSPRGGTLGGQAVHSATRKGYAGIAKRLKPKIKIIIAQ